MINRISQAWALLRSDEPVLVLAASCPIDAEVVRYRATMVATLAKHKKMEAKAERSMIELAAAMDAWRTANRGARAAAPTHAPLTQRPAFVASCIAAGLVLGAFLFN
jgi:hypothetical protein